MRDGLLRNPVAFIETLSEFDVMEVDAAVMMQVRRLLQAEDFPTPSTMRKCCSAGFHLCEWLLAVARLNAVAGGVLTPEERFKRLHEFREEWIRENPPT